MLIPFLQNLLNFLGCIVMSILLNESADVVVEESIRGIIGVDLVHLVIDLGSSRFVKWLRFNWNVTDNYTTEVRTFSLNLNETETCWQRNDTDSETFDCYKYSRLLSVEGHFRISRIEIEHSEVLFDTYVGCFSGDNIDTIKLGFGNSYICQLSCTTFYSGIREDGNCLCISNLTDLVPVKLQLCSSRCSFNEYDPCGGKKHYSVFATRLHQKNPALHRPVWKCIFDRVCKETQNGRIGVNGEIIDCSTNNGNCGDIQCQSMEFNNLTLSVCSCSDGFFLDNNFNCHDIDECKIRHPCTESFSCINSYGSFNCLCLKGFEDIAFEGSRRCQDIDECQRYEDACDNSTSICKNWQGDYACNCLDGFKQRETNILECQDIDECHERDFCDKNSTFCLNNPGSFECHCYSGFFKPAGSTRACQDVDECARINQCDVNTTRCSNTAGSYLCKCLSGFQYAERFRCRDIDECSTLLNICGKLATCINVIGTFDCKCPEGTVKTSYQHAIECEDIDECDRMNGCNKSSSFCLNVLFGYFCLCKYGYVNVDNFTCVEASQTAFTHIDYEEMTTTEEPSFIRLVGNYIMGLVLIALPFLACLIFLCLRCIIRCISKKKVESSSTISMSIGKGKVSHTRLNK